MATILVEKPITMIKGGSFHYSGGNTSKLTGENVENENYIHVHDQCRTQHYQLPVLHYQSFVVGRHVVFAPLLIAYKSQKGRGLRQ